jgi:DnaJ-class molecular chaperone
MTPRDVVQRVLAASTLYEVLGLSPGEVERGREPVLKEARRTLARSCHPDFWAALTGPDGASDAMARINVAVGTLSDPKARLRYEMTALKKTHTVCAGCKGQGETVRQRGFKTRSYTNCNECGGAGWLKK